MREWATSESVPRHILNAQRGFRSGLIFVQLVRSYSSLRAFWTAKYAMFLYADICVNDDRTYQKVAVHIFIESKQDVANGIMRYFNGVVDAQMRVYIRSDGNNL